MVSVLPPLTMRPLRMFWIAARTNARGLTPQWSKKVRSSNSTSAFTNFSGKVSRGGKRHCPSSATLAPSNAPFRSVTTVE